jgi:hypothetical protein
MTILGVLVARERGLLKSGFLQQELPSGLEGRDATNDRDIRATDVLVSVFRDIELAILEVVLR